MSSDDIIITNGQNIPIEIPYELDPAVTEYKITIINFITYKNFFGQFFIHRY